EAAREDAEMGPLSNRILTVPRYKLSFEYQGPISFARSLVEKEKILTKAAPSQLHLDLIEREELTPILVPFWWNRQKSSLLAEILRQSPTLFESGEPLSELKDLA